MTIPNVEKDVLTEQEVAHILDCEPSTIQEKARRGELPGIKVGRSWRFPRIALLQALNEKALANIPQRPAPRAVFVGGAGRKPPPALS
jgi:excisionase family DNA binding protein